MRFTLILTIVAVAMLSMACNRPVTQSNNAGTNKPASNTNKKSAKSWRAEYESAANDAIAAQKAYFQAKGGPNEKDEFLLWTEAMFRALKYARLHEAANGEGSTSNFPNISGPQGIKGMKAGDWKNEGAAYKDDPRVKAALKDFESGTN